MAFPAAGWKSISRRLKLIPPTAAQVVLIVGTNKIVKNMDEAVCRVEQVAAPMNTKRLNCKTPCEVTGTCSHCRSEGRVCCSFVRLEQQRVPDRIKVIIVNESLGY